MKGGEAYLRGGQDAHRAEVYRAWRDRAQVRCADRWEVVVLADGRTPPGWRLAGLARPDARMHDGREVWRVPGPPWGHSLTWAGPGAPLILHGPGARPGWLGPEAGPVTGACRDLAGAQAAADAWWLSETGRLIACGGPGGQMSLFREAS